jgi:hypothetical protein
VESPNVSIDLQYSDLYFAKGNIVGINATNSGSMVSGATVQVARKGPSPLAVGQAFDFINIGPGLFSADGSGTGVAAALAELAGECGGGDRGRTVVRCVSGRGGGSRGADGGRSDCERGDGQY